MKFNFDIAGIAFLIGFITTILGYADVHPLVLVLLFIFSNAVPIQIYTD